MEKTTISYYTNVNNPNEKEEIGFELFLESIKNGKWQDIVLPIRCLKNKQDRQIAKKKSPLVTVSGNFSGRSDAGLEKHSGFIAIDIDDVNPEEVKEQLRNDKYIVAAFTSISGGGLCVIFNIMPSMHRESFKGISKYLFENYKLICDPTAINVSRARFISYDPNIFISSNYDKFKNFIKEKPQKRTEIYVFENNDFDFIIRQICGQSINLCENYYDWIRIAFALTHKFGESGRNYFHLVSQFSSKYDSILADKQYSQCLRHSSGNEATIATFYYYCKQAGLSIYSERTKLIIHSASHGKKGGLSKEKVAENLQKFEQITDADDVIKQVFESNIILNEDGLINELEIWLRQNYQLKRNLITRRIEIDGNSIDDIEFNSMYLSAKKIFKAVTPDLFQRLIYSNFIFSYNPFHNFFNENMERGASGNIEKLFNSIKSKDSNYVLHFGRKWLVGIISSIFQQHSPLMMVLVGEEQNTGKTEFFRRLLPAELIKYYSESKLDAGKDDEILMAQKLIIMDDEMGGKSKKESKKLKELTSKQIFTVREPYGKFNCDLMRLAVLAGTSNDNELLNDPTGNRRIIPIYVYSIDFAIYNSIDKIDLLMEAYHLYNSGFNWRLNKEDIAFLAVDNVSFEVSNFEKEIIEKYFEIGTDEMTATDILIYLENKTKQRMFIQKIGAALKLLGYPQYRSANKRFYKINKKIKEEGLLYF